MSVSVLFFSCKKNNLVLKEEPINLYPDKELIKKTYYRYSIFDPFYINDSIYTPINHRKNDIKMPKGLIEATDPYNLRLFNKYIVDNFNGAYSSYIVRNDSILYRYYFRQYKKESDQNFSTKSKIESYFTRNKIGFKFVKYTSYKAPIYLLKKAENKDSLFCIIDSHDLTLKVHITYNVQDTIYHFASKSLNPFRTMEIEN